MRKNILFCLLILFSATLITSCKSYTGPEPPTAEYKYDIQVTYTRDPAKIRFPEGNDEYTYLFGELSYPPSIGGVEHISIQMTKVGDNQFTCTIPKIWVNSSGLYHVVRVQDPKLFIPGGENCTAYTGENIDISGSYDQQVNTTCNGLGSQLSFMIK
ncbi:MAG TPA: hypothetical protein P5524_02035 [Candidatus Paceibacterota bacterium]|nr:hypothetical protein [Candidatus Paceibacterota bacterium]